MCPVQNLYIYLTHHNRPSFAAYNCSKTSVAKLSYTFMYWYIVVRNMLFSAEGDDFTDFVISSSLDAFD